MPSALNLLSGQNPFPIRFSGLSSGVNFIYFSKTGDGSYYSNLPPLTLCVDKNYFTPVSFIETAFKLPVAAVNTNYTVAVSLPFNLFPMSQTNLTVTLSSATGLSLRNNPTVITLYPEQTSATIRLYINDATLWIIGATTNLIITPSNTVTYASAVTIPITAANPVVGIPTAVALEDSTGLKEAVFNISCSEYGRFVYHVSRKFSYNETACLLNVTEISTWSQQSSIDGLRVDETYYECEDQISQVSIVSPSVTQQLTISDLLTSTDYTLTGYCVSQIGTMSDTISANFTTDSNGGVVSKMDFVFAAVLTTAQKIKLVCALALLFEINYYRVSTADGYYCSELLSSRLLTETSPDMASASSSWRLLSATPNRIEVYFGINNDMNIDGSSAQINSLSISETEIESKFPLIQPPSATS